ncbi:MAG TPA: FkbM family methyltransferase [Vicinamibacterales bacterium]|nr:FkbM family methyltransferase [Vicinamibacterales bacterium]
MPSQYSGVTGQLHGIVSGLANRVSGHAGPLRRLLSPLYGRALQFMSGDRGITATINGETFRIDPRFRAALPAQYEPELLHVLRERLRPGGCLFDIGANLGIWVLHAARLTGPSGRIVAFEPNPSTADILRTHLRMNGIEQQVRVEPLAVGVRSGAGRLFGAVAGAGTSRLGEANRDAPAEHMAVDVTVTTLDEYCQASGSEPSVVLIDVEGFEQDVLAWGARTIGAQPDVTVVVEMHPTLWGVDGAGRMQRLLDQLGRTAVCISGQANALSEYGQVLLEPLTASHSPHKEINDVRTDGARALPRHEDR